MIRQPIVGGDELTGASPTAMVGYCSATLVQPSLIVTAAHCLEVEPTEARFGAMHVAIEYCEAHPDYGRALGMDIAFCTLASDGPRPEPAQLSSCNARRVTLVGYGYTDASERGPRVQRTVGVRVHDVRAEGRELLVGDAERGACHGDSGGSAFDDRRALVGVISRRGPALDGEPVADCANTTVVTTIEPHLAWLESASGMALSASCPVSTDGCSLSNDRAGSCSFVLLVIALQLRNRARVRFSS